MYKALFISPMIPSDDIGKSVLFFKDLLGFNSVREEDNYVILQKDGRTIHIKKAWKESESELYLEVDDVDLVWGTMKDKVQGLKVKEPFDREYGMREIHIIIPGTKTLLFIGQVIMK